MDEFDSALLEAVDETLLLLGDKVRRALYSYLRKHHGVAREEIPRKLDAFDNGLRSVLGEGAEVLGRMIARRLYGKLGIPFQEGGHMGLKDYVELAKGHG